ncbi:MAG: hypothetical protein HYW50_03905 [Candidatus Diapherotrites archaeon]|nr:hypothetical protein [Candidatus Diapherotrites archaeon]
MKHTLSDEEVALRIVEIYFEEVAKRRDKAVDFDSMINTYFYVCEKMKKKEELLASMKNKVAVEEKKLLTMHKEEIIPAVEELKEKIPEKF